MKKHLVTASYTSKEIVALDGAAKKADVILMNEVGLDPGIDHASAMKVIHHIKEQGGELISFKSYCGGLVSPESNDNPWKYKFTWNPRNVVLAGQGTAKYIEKGNYKEIPYERLFLETENINVQGCGTFEAYANRNSLAYCKVYGIEKIPTMIRGTLRNKGFCKAWNVFVRLGVTNDKKTIVNPGNLTYRTWLETFLPKGKANVKQKLIAFMKKNADKQAIDKVIWTGITGNQKIPFKKATHAEILQKLLEEKWKLKPKDKDMIVMQHEFTYKSKGDTQKSKVKTIVSSLVVTGDDPIFTAMAKTVGLPVAITAKLILQNKVQARGVVIPVIKEIYDPLLTELKTMGIIFKEKHSIG